MIRVLVVDDQTLVRQGIRTLLSLADAPFDTDEAADGIEALARIDAQRPDVVLLDLRMPRMDGIATLKALKERPNAPPVLVLTTFDDDHALREALASGARGYLLKDVRLERLSEAIIAVHQGRTLVQPGLTERLLRSLTDAAPPTYELPVEQLTPREREVARWLAAGYSNKEIARAVALQEGTVKNHVSRILAKLGAKDRTRAALRAIQEGLLDESGVE